MALIISKANEHPQSVYGDDKPLTPDGHRQCASFARWFRPQVPYITNILASPLLRATQTAEEALNEVIDRGVKIRVMDQVSGRYDAGLREQEVEERSYSGPRKERAVEYRRQWLGLRDTDIWDRGEVGEVIIVTHGMLLWDLLGAGTLRTHVPSICSMWLTLLRLSSRRLSKRPHAELHGRERWQPETHHTLNLAHKAARIQNLESRSRYASNGSRQAMGRSSEYQPRDS